MEIKIKNTLCLVWFICPSLLTHLPDSCMTKMLISQYHIPVVAHNVKLVCKYFSSMYVTRPGEVDESEGEAWSSTPLRAFCHCGKSSHTSWLQ